MITAPMLHPGIEVQLPEAEAKNLPLRVEDPLVISIRENGMVYVQEQPIHPTQLVDRLLPILEARGDDSLYVKADRNLPYGNVMEILDLLNQGGYPAGRDGHPAAPPDLLKVERPPWSSRSTRSWPTARRGVIAAGR